MNKIKIFSVLVAGAMLTSCTSLESPVNENRTEAQLFLSGGETVEVKKQDSTLKGFVLADIEAALELAKAGEDRLAIMCWEKLAEIAKSDAGKTRVKGALSAFQKARNIRRRVQSGPDEDLQVSCAPMAVGSGTAVMRMIRRLALGGVLGL